MRTSDGMVLGLGLIKFNPSHWLFNGCGCLIGADYVAQTGKLSSDVFGEGPCHSRSWYDEVFPVPLRLQKTSLRFKYLLGGTTQCTARVIISEWAHQLHSGYVTLDEVIAWVRANEPSEAVDPEDEPLFATKELTCK